MKLSELLTELRSNILYDRSDREAGSSDVLWSDDTLIRYIDQAQRRFARRSLILRENKACELTRVTLRTGVEEYALHPAVLAVISARYAEGIDLTRVGHSQLDAYRPPDPIYWDINTLALMNPGKPLAFTTDEALSDDRAGALSRVTMRFFPKPSADYNGTEVYLRVVRLPIDTLNPTNLDAEPEIPEDYQLDMLDWAAYLALRIVDRDAGDAQRAQAFRASFEQHVKAARDDTMRKLFTPEKWGFGLNGFTYER